MKRQKVIIAGGGIAGISAALAAVRNGAEVTLIEKQCVLGGLATAGLIAIYLPLCDGMGRQMCFGLCEELALLAASYQPEIIPKAWREKTDIREMAKIRYEFEYNPQMLALLADELLRKEGVHILYDTRICDVAMANEGDSSLQKTDSIDSNCRRKLKALIIENISGRQAIDGDAFVDATGDASLFYMAKVPTREFADGNRVAAWYYYVDKKGLHLKILGECDSTEVSRGNEAALDGARYTGLDVEANSQLISASRKMALEDIRKHREADAAYEPVTIATMMQVRMTRAFRGVYELSDKEQDVYFHDSIGMIGDWRKKDRRYEIPFRTLYARDVSNLIGAGRCISVDDGMWDITRVIPGCAITGEAAGLAASMTNDFAALDIRTLQNKLVENGQKIH